MAQGRAWGKEVAAQVVADLLIGWYTYREIAKRSGVSLSTVAEMKRRYLQHFER